MSLCRLREKDPVLAAAPVTFLYLPLDMSVAFTYLVVVVVTSSSAMAERPRELGDFKKARVNGGTNNHSL